jgi:hypothetical protein
VIQVCHIDPIHRVLERLQDLVTLSGTRIRTQRGISPNDRYRNVMKPSQVDQLRKHGRDKLDATFTPSVTGVSVTAWRVFGYLVTHTRDLLYKLDMNQPRDGLETETSRSRDASMVSSRNVCYRLGLVIQGLGSRLRSRAHVLLSTFS